MRALIEVYNLQCFRGDGAMAALDKQEYELQQARASATARDELLRECASFMDQLTNNQRSAASGLFHRIQKVLS